MKHVLSLLALLPLLAFGQGEVLKGRGPFTAADTLKGSYVGVRQGSNLLHYVLNLTIDPTTQSLQGDVGIEFEITGEAFQAFRFELHEHFTVTDVVDYSDTANGAAPEGLKWQQHGSFYTVWLRETIGPGYVKKILVQYEGKPVVARRAPWDGGFVWAKDPSGKPWVSVACEGEGASLWWPVKDHPLDEPDRGVTLHIAVPKGLVAVGNGRLTNHMQLNDFERFTWEVKSPINLYNVNVAIGDYTHIPQAYVSKTTGDTLSLDYYVLQANGKRAQAHFTQEVPPMLEAFEHHFGPYPWYADGYKLVETPFWGMEHQSSIAYGNQYAGLPGWLPFEEKDLFDFIIVHESGHEWFGNSISAGDKADLWIHEAFTTYAEAVYIEYHHGYEKAQQYLNAQRKLIENQQTVMGPAGVAFDAYPDADMYFKGSWMLHTLRHAYTAQLLAEQAVASEAEATEMWWAVIRKFYQTHAKQVIRYSDVNAFFEAELGPWAGTVLTQYLQYLDFPTLELHRYPSPDGKLQLDYRLVTPYKALTLPLVFDRGVALQPVVATTEWQTLNLGPQTSSGAPVTVGTERFLLNIKEVTDTNEE